MPDIIPLNWKNSRLTWLVTLDTSLPDDAVKAKRIFICHDAGAETEDRGWPARTYAHGLPEDTKRFLSSDWESIESGESWFLAIVGSIRCCDAFHVVVAREEAWRNPFRALYGKG